MQIFFRFRWLLFALAMSLALSGFVTRAGESTRNPTPGPEALQRARKLVKEVDATDFERAKSPSLKEQLANKLFDYAHLLNSDPASSYALLEQACRLVWDVQKHEKIEIGKW